MQRTVKIAATDSALLQGDWELLLAQIGTAHATVTFDALAARVQSQPLDTLSAVRAFLVAYRDDQLLARDLPAVHAAFLHAMRGETRELIGLDQSPGTGPALEPLRSASRRSGSAQLARLRPLRDFRVAQRYLLAVESGEAQGWHALAYGVTLAAYAVPLRQGLLHFVRATLESFAGSASRPLGLTAAVLRDLLNDICEPVGPAVACLLGPCPVSQD